MNQGKRVRRDPYYYWKIINMILACGVLLLSLLILLGGKEGLTVSLAFGLGAVMCALSGIMELAKGKRVVGYLCSVSAGILAVALMISVVGLWLW